MYTEHFSLKSLPFENVADPACFFERGDYSRVLSRMIDSVSAGKGLMLVAGPIGTGKTTLSQRLMLSLPPQTRLIWLGEPPETSEDLLQFICQELGIAGHAASRVFVLRDIRAHLLQLNEAGGRCLLIIDEVHKIGDDVLECVRLLNNLEQRNIKLIQMLLLGQEEFLVKLADPRQEAFKQRIAWLEAIGKMSSQQTLDYIQHRVAKAGGRKDLFDQDAVAAIAAASRGTPRLINTFCDRALRVACETGKRQVDADSVRRAADEIGLGSEVFLWLTNRRAEQAAKITLPQALSRRDAPSASRSTPKSPEPRFNRAPRSAATAEPPPSWAFPLLLLSASLLLFGSSLWFLFSSSG